MGGVSTVSDATLTMLASLREDELTIALGQTLYPLVARHQPHKAGEIVSALLGADRNELIGLLESPALLESAVSQVLPNLHPTEKIKLGSSPRNSRLLSARTTEKDSGPHSNTPSGDGAGKRGGHDNDQQDS